jgi:flagellar hook-basal body complex protein FliE
MSMIEKASAPSTHIIGDAHKAAIDRLGESFKSALDEAVGSMQSGENAMSKTAGDQIDVLATLVAINNAEAAMNTIVGIRDRVVNGYNETMRMAM